MGKKKSQVVHSDDEEEEARLEKHLFGDKTLFNTQFGKDEAVSEVRLATAFLVFVNMPRTQCIHLFSGRGLSETETYFFLFFGRTS